jgi:hypothetical protein
MNHTLHYRGRPVVFYADERVYFSPTVTVLEADHPIRRFVMVMSLYLFEVAWGRVDGPPSCAHARVFARAVLMPQAEFAPVEELSDACLAERFNVPLEMVAQYRLDLALVPLHLRG